METVLGRKKNVEESLAEKTLRNWVFALQACQISLMV